MRSRLSVCLLVLALVASVYCGGGSPAPTAHNRSPGSSASARSPAATASADPFPAPRADPCLLITSAEIKTIFAEDLPDTQPAPGECKHSGHLSSPSGTSDCGCNVTVTVQSWYSDSALIRQQHVPPNASSVVPLAVGDAAFEWGTSGWQCCLILLRHHVLVDLVGAGTPLDHNGDMASPPQTAFEAAAKLMADRL
jgi:hypothetical protein